MNWIKYEHGIVKDGQSVIICIDRGKYRLWVEAKFSAETSSFEHIDEYNVCGDDASEKDVTHVLFIELPDE